MYVNFSKLVELYQDQKKYKDFQYFLADLFSDPASLIPYYQEKKENAKLETAISNLEKIKILLEETDDLLNHISLRTKVSSLKSDLADLKDLLKKRNKPKNIDYLLKLAEKYPRGIAPEKIDNPRVYEFYGFPGADLVEDVVQEIFGEKEEIKLEDAKNILASYRKKVKQSESLDKMEKIFNKLRSYDILDTRGERGIGYYIVYPRSELQIPELAGSAAKGKELYLRKTAGEYGYAVPYVASGLFQKFNVKTLQDLHDLYINCGAGEVDLLGFEPHNAKNFYDTVELNSGYNDSENEEFDLNGYKIYGTR